MQGIFSFLLWQNMFKKTLLTIALGAVLASAQATTSDSKTVSINTTIVPFDVLGINTNDPRYNVDAPLQFALGEQGYFPLTGMMIPQEKRNPFTINEVFHGYLFAKKAEVSKNDIAIVNKLTGTNYRYDALNTFSANLVRLVIDKSYLLGEYITNSELTDWISKEPIDSRERAESNLMVLQKFFAMKNVDRDRTDKEFSQKLNELYQQAQSLLSDELKRNLDIEYYLKSLLYQDEDTKQVSEVVLLNTLSPLELGELSAVSEVVINAMIKLNLPVKINTHARPVIQGADKVLELDFAGEFTRIYGNSDALAYQLKVMDKLIIEQDKDTLNHYQFTFETDNHRYTAKGKMNKAARGLEFELDNFINGQLFYVTISGDDLTLYADPNNGGDLVMKYKRTNGKSLSETEKFSLLDYKKISLEAPKSSTPLSGKQEDLSVFKPSSVSLKWLTQSEFYTVNLKELLRLEKVYQTSHDYGISLEKSNHSNHSSSQKVFDAEPYIERFIVVNSISADYKKEALDCDNLRTGAGVVPLKLEHDVSAYFSLNDYVGPTSPSFLSATVPYKTGQVCMVVNFGKHLSLSPELLNEGVKLMNSIIREYATGK